LSWFLTITNWAHNGKPGQVAQVNEDEQAEQERGPAQAVLAHRLHDDAFFDELDGAFGQVAHALRGDLRVLAHGQQEHEDADQCRGDGDQGDLVERGEQVLPAQDRVDQREFERVCEHRVRSCVTGGRVSGRGGQVRWRRTSSPRRGDQGASR